MKLDTLVAVAPDDSIDEDRATYEWAAEVLFEVRKQRSEAKQALKVPISNVIVRAPAGLVARMPAVEADLRAALRVRAFDTAASEAREIRVVGYDAP